MGHFKNTFLHLIKVHEVMCQLVWVGHWCSQVCWAPALSASALRRSWRRGRWSTCLRSVLTETSVCVSFTLIVTSWFVFTGAAGVRPGEPWGREWRERAFGRCRVLQASGAAGGSGPGAVETVSRDHCRRIQTHLSGNIMCVHVSVWVILVKYN